LSSKSGALSFLNNLDIPTPLGVLEIYDFEEILNSLSILISKNLNTDVWILKID